MLCTEINKYHCYAKFFLRSNKNWKNKWTRCEKLPLKNSESDSNHFLIPIKNWKNNWTRLWKIAVKKFWAMAISKNFLFDEPGSALLPGEELKFLPPLRKNFRQFFTSGRFFFGSFFWSIKRKNRGITPKGLYRKLIKNFFSNHFVRMWY